MSGNLPSFSNSVWPGAALFMLLVKSADCSSHQNFTIEIHFSTFFLFFAGSSGDSVNLNPAPSKTAKERAPASSKAGAPGTRQSRRRERLGHPPPVNSKAGALGKWLGNHSKVSGIWVVL